MSDLHVKRRNFLAGILAMGALAGSRMRIPEFVPVVDEDARFLALGHKYAQALARSMVYTKKVRASDVYGRVYSDWYMASAGES